MFENNVFEEWLDTKSTELVSKIGSGQSLSSEEMIILVLKAQSNHFAHLDQDLRSDMQVLAENTKSQIIAFREDMDKRFEQVDKRFEQAEKRFEQVEKRFELMLGRLDRFMFWSLGLTVSSTLFILGYLEFGM